MCIYVYVRECVYVPRMHIYMNALASTPVRVHAMIDALSSLRNSEYIDERLKVLERVVQLDFIVRKQKLWIRVEYCLA